MMELVKLSPVVCPGCAYAGITCFQGGPNVVGRQLCRVRSEDLRRGGVLSD